MGGDVSFFGLVSCWFKFSVSGRTHPSITLISSGDGGHKELAVNGDHKIYVQVPVMLTERSWNQAVDIHNSNITCTVLLY